MCFACIATAFEAPVLQHTTSLGRVMTDIDVGCANLLAGTNVTKGVNGKTINVRIVAMVDVGRAGVVKPRGL